MKLLGLERILRISGGLMAVCVAGSVALQGNHASAAETLSTLAPSAFLYSPATGTTLFAKEAEQAFAPGSLAKVMTAAVVFEALEIAEINADRTCLVSEHAWRKGGAPSRTATMFAAIKSEIPVIDLLRGLLVHNANDAAIILAECLDGNEDAFTARMNAHAEALGMSGTRYVSPTGFEADDGSPQARTTVRDQVRLAEELLTRFKGRYGLFAESEFTWNKIYQRNKNPLLGEIRGLDGIGAGQNERDGYSALVSVERNGRRIIAAVSGLSSDKARLQAVREVVDGAWDYFTVQTLYRKGEVIADARVHDGVAGSVPLTAVEDVDVLLPRGGTLDYRLRVVYSGPLKAPVKAGTVAGELRVLGKDGVIHRTALTTGSDVSRGDTKVRALDGLKELLFGWF